MLEYLEGKILHFLQKNMASQSNLKRKWAFLLYTRQYFCSEEAFILETIHDIRMIPHRPVTVRLHLFQRVFKVFECLHDSFSIVRRFIFIFRACYKIFRSEHVPYFLAAYAWEAELFLVRHWWDFSFALMNCNIIIYHQHE